jgi:type IX secretion system PorP/SprF family membrane protein
MKKNLLLLVLAFVCSLNIALAQDPHFSQFYYSPLTINPALTGDIAGNWRVGLNYRNQWGSISAPSVYATPSVFADFRLFSGRYSGNSMGLGVVLLTDKAGDGQLTTTSAMFSAAYHQALDNSGNYHLSAGGMAGWTQKGIDISRLDFYDEFTGTGFQPGFASADPIFNSSFAYLDVMGGIAFTGLITDYSRVAIGTSVAHVSTPTESFYVVDRTNELGIRYNVHATATIGVKNKLY